MDLVPFYAAFVVSNTHEDMTQTEVFETEGIDFAKHSLQRLQCDFFHGPAIGAKFSNLNFQVETIRRKQDSR